MKIITAFELMIIEHSFNCVFKEKNFQKIIIKNHSMPHDVLTVKNDDEHVNYSWSQWIYKLKLKLKLWINSSVEKLISTKNKPLKKFTNKKDPQITTEFHKKI